MAHAPRAPRSPPVATRRLTRDELTRLGFSPGSKRHVAAHIKRVTRRTKTWSERQAVQAGKGVTKEAFTKAVEAGTAAYASETVAKRQRHIAHDRQMKKAVPSMTKEDRLFMVEARDAYLASRPLTPGQKDRWKSVFARYPIGELYALFGYSTDASGAFPFEIAA
jgi:hypothetical protein